MLQAILNTQVYLGGSPFDGNGDDTYQLSNWAKDAEVHQITFLRDKGDASQIRLEFYDRDAEAAEAKILHSEIVGHHARLTYYNVVKLEGVKKDRIYLRLVALDGTEQNHCKLVIKGLALES